MVTAEQIIELLGLEPLPTEGGLYRQTYQSSEFIPKEALPARYGTSRAFCTAIYYLLTDDPNSFSALHKLPTDEIYHFYLGDPVEILLLHPDGHSHRAILGHDLLRGHHVQFVVPQGVWQGSHLLPGGRFALLGTTVAPAFISDDYVGGDREELVKQYPQEAELIRRLTRPDAPRYMPAGGGMSR